MTYYDPDHAPTSREWLALDDAEKMRVIGNHHSAERIPATEAHVFAHYLAENELARGHGPSKRAAERVALAGLSRHEAVHAIGRTIADHYRAWIGRDAQQDQGLKQRALNAAIDALPGVSDPPSGDL